MTTIELTEQQRQVLQAEQGQPVEVVDPATSRRYVLLAREQFERVRPLLNGSPKPGSNPPALPPPLATGDKEVVRVRLRDLPTPPEVLEEIERWCKQYGCGGKRSRRELEDQFKLQYYYGGQELFEVRSPEGLMVIPIPQRYHDTPDLRYVLLTPEERPHACYTVPDPWDDMVSRL